MSAWHTLVQAEQLAAVLGHADLAIVDCRFEFGDPQAARSARPAPAGNLDDAQPFARENFVDLGHVYVLHLIAQKPWTGWGWGELKYAHYMASYPGERFCDILGNAHNLPLHLAVTLGLPLALAACAGLLTLLWRAHPWRLQGPADQRHPRRCVRASSPAPKDRLDRRSLHHVSPQSPEAALRSGM